MLLVLFLTADLKYHQFYEAENQPFRDIGHLNVIQNYIVDYLRKKSLILQSFYQKKYKSS
jgi:phosphoribosylaminoimidazole carboxylase (NCAIR synthetase)